MRLLCVTAICAAAGLWSGQGYAAPTVSTIHTFDQTDGQSPESALIQDGSGALYGTTTAGGRNNTNCSEISSAGSASPAGCGVAFKLAPPTAGTKTWTETVLHDFKGGADGIVPAAGLLADKAGNLYGVTIAGGAGASFCPGKANGRTDVGCGIVYKLTRPAAGKTVWAETVLFRFTGTNGAEPLGTLIFDARGNLYGTTAAGGNASACPASTDRPAGCGVAFKLTRPAAGKTAWTETVLHSFAGGTDGAFAAGGLVFDKSGNLFGVTREGGGTSDTCAANPAQGVGGGCGIAFKLSHAAGDAWAETVIRRFAGKTHPANPIAALVFDSAGNLYGTSNGGGGHVTAIFPNGGGTVFELSPPAAGMLWTERVLHAFGGANDGVGAIAGVVMDPAGNLYGTAYSGATFGGAVYKLARPVGGTGAWKETLLAKFTNGPYAPVGGLLFNKQGNLFGTILGGLMPPYADGSVYKLTP